MNGNRHPPAEKARHRRALVVEGLRLPSLAGRESPESIPRAPDDDAEGKVHSWPHRRVRPWHPMREVPLGGAAHDEQVPVTKRHVMDDAASPVTQEEPPLRAERHRGDEDVVRTGPELRLVVRMLTHRVASVAVVVREHRVEADTDGGID